MDINEIKTFIESNQDNEEVKNYIGGFITPDRVSGFLESEDGKKILQPKLDSYHAKGLDSWKTNNLDKLYQERFSKENPAADPKDVELNKLKAEFEVMKNESTRKELTNKALKTAQEKKLPTDLIDYFVGNDEETTSKNLEKFIATMAAHDEAIKLEFARGNSYTPPGTNGNVGGDEKTREEISKYMK